MAKIKINCTNLGRVEEVEAGLTLSEIASALNVKLPNTILGATVNNKITGLTYRVYQPKQITYFDISSTEGRRTYSRSLILMLYAAVSDVMPATELNVLHSVSRGLYCELRKGGKLYEPSLEDIDSIKSRMKELHRMGLPIVRQEMETERALELMRDMDDTERLMQQDGDIYSTVHSLEDHYVTMHGDLVPSTSYLTLFELKPYYSGMLLQAPSSQDPQTIAPMTRQDKMFATFTEFDKWCDLLNIQRLADLNDAIDKGYGNPIIQLAEALHEKKVAEIADMIAARRGSVKVVLIAGPSSSGKTTFSKRLGVQLMVNGIKPVTLSIDNYFVNREDTPRDADGKPDFEAVEAIDVKLFNEQLLALIAGDEVEIPKYSFVKGERYYDGTKLRLMPNSVLVIEGTHGLTPQLTPMVPEENKFKIYAAPLAGINFDHLTRIATTDNRLVRRIVRDYYNRGHNAEATIAMWPSVRRGEDRFIYPNQEQADVMFNSALMYEMSVLKKKAETILMEVPRNSPHYATAHRLIKFLRHFRPLDDASIPPTSILREFCGGSSFSYD